MDSIHATPAAAVDVAPISVDLMASSYRSDDFPQDWPCEQRQRSLRRYVRWLQLKQRHPSRPMAPTRDIDLFWHLHMLSPVAYHRDCMRLFGQVLDHDGGFGKADGELDVLKAVFLATGRLWEQTYGEPYGEDGAPAEDQIPRNCWHDCVQRCWHACASK